MNSLVSPRKSITGLLVWLVLLQVGCGAYQLRGRVVEGSTSLVMVVDRNDARLQGYGLPGARVELTLDPNRLNARRLPPTITDGDGHFAIPVDEFGAGSLEYDVQLTAQLPGHHSASQSFRLPGGSRRVLVVLAPGRDGRSPRQESLLEETMRMGGDSLNR